MSRAVVEATFEIIKAIRENHQIGFEQREIMLDTLAKETCVNLMKSSLLAGNEVVLVRDRIDFAKSHLVDGTLILI